MMLFISLIVGDAIGHDWYLNFASSVNHAKQFKVFQADWYMFSNDLANNIWATVSLHDIY